MHETCSSFPARDFSAPRRVGAALLLLAALAFGGCFSERSFPMNPKRAMTFTRQQIDPESQPLSTRNWTARAAALASNLLPDGPDTVLTTDELSANGQPIDVYGFFDINPDNLDDLLTNLDGLQQTAQVVSPERELDAKGHLLRPKWDLFVDVEVPGQDGTPLYGRLSEPLQHQIPHTKHETRNAKLARMIPGAAAVADSNTYIVITHGLFGSIDGIDMLNQVNAFRTAGYHVLALEMRGHGETQCRHPEATLSFGIHESGDLVSAANWLKTKYHARRVGLVTFSLGGYEGLLTAWLDGARPVTRFSHFGFLKDLPRPRPEPAFNAGMVIVSSPVDIISTADRFDKPLSLLEAPLKATFQEHIARRAALYGETPTRSMWGLAEREFYRAGWGGKYGDFKTIKPELVSFLDFSAHDWEEGVRRMENVRVPVLMINSANDPLGTAQGVADLFGRVKNPNIGAVMTAGGGHMAFTAYAADYYYTLLLNFFNPVTGPVAQHPLPLAKTP
jgi:predicted alpha/beta-fold hydrolase